MNDDVIVIDDSSEGEYGLIISDSDFSEGEHGLIISDGDFSECEDGLIISDADSNLALKGVSKVVPEKHDCAMVEVLEDSFDSDGSQNWIVGKDCIKAWGLTFFDMSSEKLYEMCAMNDMSRLAKTEERYQMIEILYRYKSVLSSYDIYIEDLTRRTLERIYKCYGYRGQASESEMRDKIFDKIQNGSEILGYIYIIEANVYKDCVKIGQTKNRRSESAVKKYLYNRYRTSLGNVNIYLFPSTDHIADEIVLHDKLMLHRIGNTELFNVELEKAIQICSKITQRCVM